MSVIVMYHAQIKMSLAVFWISLSDPSKIGQSLLIFVYCRKNQPPIEISSIMRGLELYDSCVVSYSFIMLL